jgi:hypothetical protein
MLQPSLPQTIRHGAGPTTILEALLMGGLYERAEAVARARVNSLTANIADAVGAVAQKPGQIRRDC